VIEVADCYWDGNLNPQSAISIRNQQSQSAISIRNQQSQSAISNLNPQSAIVKIDTHQSAFSNVKIHPMAP
jgi:hypothetical protein